MSTPSFTSGCNVRFRAPARVGILEHVVPRQSPTIIGKIARAVASGRRQQKIAEELGVTTSAVQRALGNMRRELVAQTADPAWLDTSERAPVEVATRWLQLHPEDD